MPFFEGFPINYPRRVFTDTKVVPVSVVAKVAPYRARPVRTRAKKQQVKII